MTIANEMDYPVERIREMKTWTYFIGFTGSVCKGCHKKANVLAGTPGWMCCLCGTFNPLPARKAACPDPFDVPDYGPTRAVIQQGCEDGCDV